MLPPVARKAAARAPKAAAVYCRISDDREGLSLGVARQREDCLALCRRRRWPVAEIYTDNDVSAYSGKPRPAYRRMLRDLKEGARDAVVVYHQDRLVRQPRELEEFFDVCDQAGVKDLATVTGDLDLSNDDHRTIARIMGALAQKESNDKSRRIKRKHLELAQRGEPAGGGARPFGYKQDRRSMDRKEARVIREVAGRILAGESLRSVCTDLNRRKIRTSAGGDWTQHSLRRVLSSARIAGLREYQGEIYGRAVWGAIITREQSMRLRALLSDERRRSSRTPRYYLLKGILRCHACGSSLVGRRREDGARRYVCAKGPGLAGCGKTVVMAEDVEAFLTEAVLYRLDTPELQAALRQDAASDAEAARIQRELDKALAQADELARAYAEEEITMRDWLHAKAPIQDRIEACKRSLSRIQGVAPISDYIGNASSLRAEWSSLDLSRQQAIISAVLDSVLVGPAVRGRNFFDPSRLTPTWRA